MRRTTFIAVSAFMLASCARPSSVAPEEVLRLTALANQELSSASFDVDAEFDIDSPQFGGRMNGNVTAIGAMQNGGRQSRTDLRTEGTLTTDAGSSDWNIDAEIIVAGENETYLKINTLNIDPPAPVFSLLGLDQALGAWVRLPPGEALPGSAPVTPDPRFLRMQSEIVTVTKDHGIVSLGGHDVHHYDVTADRQKLADFLQSTGSGSLDGSMQNLEMTGEMWIDSESYVIRRIRWSVTSTDAAQPVSIGLTVNIDQHNEPVIISPPADARALSVPQIPAGIPGEITIPSAE